MVSGRLITIEGIDGTGKTTLAGSLRSALLERGVDVELLREPGGVELAERLREVVKDPGLVVSARAEALIYAAARAQLVEEAIRPRLEKGGWVLLDRFVDSSLAYQGAGRGLGIEAVATLNEFATGGLVADRTLLLVLPAEVARERAAGRALVPDRLEREQDDFFTAVAAAYEELAASDPGRVRVISGADPPQTVLERALEAVSDLL